MFMPPIPPQPTTIPNPVLFLVLVAMLNWLISYSRIPEIVKDVISVISLIAVVAVFVWFGVALYGRL